MNRTEPKFKNGDRVYAAQFGFGKVKDSYKGRGQKDGPWLYHISQRRGFLLGNIPESYIHLEEEVLQRHE